MFLHADSEDSDQTGRMEFRHLILCKHSSPTMSRSSLTVPSTEITEFAVGDAILKVDKIAVQRCILCVLPTLKTIHLCYVCISCCR